MKPNNLIFLISLLLFWSCSNNQKSIISTEFVRISIENSPGALWEYQADQVKQVVAPPVETYSISQTITG